ncbi:DUF4199 domain-containing protein [Aquimarina mytili]|uniref:DUF4199 domain-containing protein n=1 Tax=Aquimarina mytili TaxID=874423 RepID=A0A937DA63_9FLAO|nr:DUF4199 domain-containing protein [Aquimarina mytili]MBL0685705.1 DUF4199 domain-containing protein [Aquimarina mytili]
MKDTTISTKKFILKCGLILGVIWGIYFLIRFATDNLYYTEDWFFSIIELLLHFNLIFPIYLYKSFNKGILKLSEALKIGVAISLITGLMWTTYIVLVEIIQPEFVIQTLNESKEKMLINKPNISPEEMHETIISDKKFNLFGGFIFHLIIDFVISLIAGAILRKKKSYR